jgi:arylsulfatase A-like enzyme
MTEAVQRLRLTTTLGLALGVTLALGSGACGKANGDKPRPTDQGSEKPTAGDGAAKGGSEAAKGTPPVRAAARGPEHPVYSLVDNRLAAHVQRQGGLVAIPASPGFVKYTRFGKGGPSWKRDTFEGTAVATVGQTGRFLFPLTAAQASGTPTIWLRLHAEGARRAGFRFNGDQKKEVTVEVPAGWSTVQVTAPEGALREGENELLLFMPTAGSRFAWLQVGGSAAPDAAPPLHDPASDSLILPDGGGLAWYVAVPDKALVTGDLADGACQIAVQATGEDGKTVEGTLAGLGSAVDLAALGGQAARLELTAKGCPEAKLAKAALVVPGAAATAPAKGAAPKYVILLIMDSLRADRVRPFNPKARPETPTWEALAESSALFLQNYVQGNESRVSHASIWSSLYAAKHNMLGDKSKLDTRWTTIDEVAKSAGLYTAGVSANGYVDPRWGMGQKWDHYSNHIHASKGLKGEDVLAAAIDVVKDKKEPWFLYIGMIDTHVSWRAKEPWISKYDSAPYSGKFKETFSGADAAAYASGKLKMTDRDKDRVRAIYDSNVSYQDELLRQLIEKLKEWGIYDQTMIVITGDHGDEQWEDGRMGHGGSLRDSLEHVPLLVHYPAQIPAGLYPDGAEVIDIVPTMAEALGVEASPEWQGTSLIPIIQGVAPGAGYARMSFASNQESSWAGRIGKWKLFSPGVGAPRVYDLSADPDEKSDLAGKAHIGQRLVTDAFWQLRAHNKEWSKATWGNAANVTPAFATAVEK